MMREWIGGGAVVLSFFLARLTLDLEKVQACRWLCASGGEIPVEKRALAPGWRLAGASIAALCAAVTVWRLLVSTHDTLNVLKLSIALVCLTGSACVDYLEHRIPNLFPAVLAAAAVLLMTAGCLTGQAGAQAYIFSSVFAALASSVCFIVGSILSHQGIGMGDIKLISALALMGGVYIVGGTLFFSMTACALVSGYLLITRKKTMKEAIPFAPFLLIGYMMTICVIKF